MAYKIVRFLMSLAAGVITAAAIYLTIRYPPSYADIGMWVSIVAMWVLVARL